MSNYNLEERLRKLRSDKTAEPSSSDNSYNIEERLSRLKSAYGTKQDGEGTKGAAIKTSAPTILPGSALDEERRERDAFEREYGYSQYRNTEDFKKNSATTGSKRKLYLFDPSTWNGKGDLYDFINDIDGYREHVAATQGGPAQSYNDYEDYISMTEDEIDMYNYLYNKQGKDSASQYLSDLKPILGERRTAVQEKRLGRMTDKGAVSDFLLSLATAPTNQIGGILSAVDLAAQTLNRWATGEDVNYNSVGQRAGEAAPFIRSEIGQDIEDKTNFTIAGKNVGRFLYDTAMSGLDSLYSGALGENVGGALLGINAATSTARDIAARGGNDNQALIGGIMAGAAESFFEKFSIGNFKKLKDVPVATFKDFALNIAKSMGVNASEEAATEATNLFFDKVILGDLSTWDTTMAEFEAQGMDKNEARRKTIGVIAGQVTEAAASGALMGLGFGGLGSASSAAASRSIGAQIQDVDPLRQAALEMQDSDSHRLAQKIGEDPSNMQAGALLRTLAEDTAARYMGQGMSEGEARQKAADDVFALLKPETAAKAAPAQQQDTTSPAAVKPSETAVEASEVEPDINTPPALEIENRGVATMQKAVYNDSGAEVEVEGISSVENGQVYVQLSDGGTASVDDISFDDTDIDQLYAQAAQFDTDTAKAFIAGYEGGSVANYLKGFKSMQGSAKAGLTYEQASESVYAQEYLSDNGRQYAYAAGQRAAAPQQSGYGVVRKFSSKLSTSQSQALKGIDAVAKAINRKVNIVDTIPVTDAKGSIVKGAVNAYFDENTNEYYIALDSIGEAYSFFALHESIHDIAKNNELGYTTLEEIVFDVLKEQGADIDALLEVQKKLYRNESEAYWREEIVANTVPAILTDKATADMFVDRIIGADADTRTVFERILDSILDFLQKAYDVLKGEKSWQQMELVKQNQDAIERIRDAYFAALEDLQGAEVKTEQEAIEFSDANTKYSVRDEAPPKKTGIAYKVFVAKDGQLYPPMVPNPHGEGTPIGVWLNADAGEMAAPSKTGRPQVQAGGKGTGTGKTSLAYRPGWHLGDIPLAKQFARKNPETGVKDLFPANFVWAECEYAMDVDYQEEAMSYGYTENGKFRHSYAGLPRLPKDGYYRYRTNPNPDTVPWVITGAMRVTRILTDAETDEICRKNGVEPMQRQGGAIDLAKYGLEAGPTTNVLREGVRFSAKDEGSLKIKEQIALHQDELNGMDPVANLDSEPRPRRNNIPDRTLMRKALQKFYGSLEYSVDRKGFGTVQFDESALGEVVRYIKSDAEFAAAKAAPAIVKRGIQIDHHTEHKDRGKTESYTFAAPVVLNGKRGNAAVVVQFTNRNKPHCVRILMPDGSGFNLDAIEKSSQTDSAATENGSRQQHIGSASTDSIADLGAENKRKFSMRDSEGNTLSEQQAEYFKDSKAVDADGNLQVVYHGTVGGDFTIFDRSYGNYDGDFGRGFYFTTEYGDVEANYANEDGPDLQNKIARMAERLEAEGEFEDYDEAEEYARTQLIKDEPRIIEAYLNIQNPVYIGGEKETWFEFYEEYDEETDEYGEATGELVEFVEALDTVLNSGDFETSFDPREIFGNFYEGVKVSELIAWLKNETDLTYAESTENYDFASGEIIRATLEEMGYDGIIDTTVGEKFKNMSYVRGATHYIVFDSNQAKYTTNKTPTTNPDIRFSLNDTASVSTAALESELAKKDKVIADLKAQFKLTEGHKVSDKALDKLAGKILKDYSSKYDRETLVDNLRTMFDYIANTEQPVWEDIVQQGTELAKAVLKESSELDTDLYEYYSQARDYLRNTPIVLNGNQRAEAAYLMDSYRNYRQALFGSVKLANSGTPLDVAWQEIGQTYPELFSEDSSEGDMVTELLAVVNMMKPVYRNPYGYDMDGAAYDLFLSLYDEYFEIPEVKTFADKKAAELAAVKAKFRNRIVQMRQDSKAKYNEKLKKLRADNVAKRQELSRKYNEAKAKQHKADMERYREQYRKLSDRKNEQLIKQKAAFQAWKQKDRQRSEIKKYQQRIEKKAKDLSAWLMNPTDKKHVPESLRNEVAKFLETIEFTGSAKAADWRYRMESLASFMDKLDSVEGEAVYLDLEDSFAEAVRDMAKAGGNLVTMDTAQLKELDRILSQLKKAVQEVNTIIVNGRRQEITDFGDEVIERADAKGTKYGGNNPVAKLLSSGNIKPVYFFKNLGGPMQKLFNEVREAQNKVAFGAQAAKEFYQKAAAKHNVSKWKDDTLKMRTDRGDSIELTRQEAMSLYAIYKREQFNKNTTGAAHLSKGGFVYANEQTKERTGKLGVKRKATFKDAKPKPISDADMAKIAGWLTAEQKAFADELVEYMSTTMAGIGNTTSLKISGYKKFAEGYYFPYKSSRAFLKTQAGAAGQDNNNRWKNWGSAKATQAGANNPIVLQNFSEVWADHVNEMLMYAHMSIPQENLLKVFNYKTGVTDEETSKSVKAAIQNAYGEAAMKYIDTLLSDLGGNVLADPRDNFGSQLTSRFKKGAVLGSLSVIIQQPSSIVRAMALVDPKYFATTSNKGSFDEAMKYAGTAVIKRIGGFDTGTGHGMADWITELEPEKKVKAFFDLNDSAYRDKVLGWAPGKMDEKAWGYLWEAVKNEVAEKQHLKSGSAEHLEAAGKRFNDVVEYTQVYDSTISRSELMRSKSAAAQMATSFMAEPVTAYNMLYDAFINKTDVPASRALAAFIGSTVFNALLKSVVYAARDDDEQAYWEKYIEAVTDSLLGGKAEKIKKIPIYGLGSDLNPLNMIPYARDVMSIMQGYDVERADMALIGDFVGAMEKVFSDNTTGMEKFREAAQAISAFFGIPVKNVWRDIEAVWDTAKMYVLGDSKIEVTERGIQNAIRSGLGSETSVKAEAENLYSAYEKGDTKRLQRALNEISAQYTDKVDALVRSGKTKQEAEKSARSSILTSCTGVLKDYYLNAPTIAKKMEIRSLALRIRIGNKQLYAGYDFDQHWK